MRKRLDVVLVERGLVPTRSRARDLIKYGKVLVDQQVCTKAGAEVGVEQALTLEPGSGAGVSRAGAKLAAALDAFGFDPTQRIALDVGASTGGFTEVLLERGAAKVYAVDVGHGQLHARLKADPRVVSLEGCDARALTRATDPRAHRRHRRRRELHLARQGAARRAGAGSRRGAGS